MRRFLSVVLVLVSAVVLASCSLLPYGPPGVPFPDSGQKADARMKQIAAALNAHDAAALKAMFSKRALEKATDLDKRLDSLFSLFPSGGLTWKQDASATEGDASYGTELLNSYYKVSAGGIDYSLFFADFPLDKPDPDNVGLYALGVALWADDRGSGPSEPFFHWAGSMRIDKSNKDGYPGVYAGYDNSQLSLQRLPQIVDKLNIQDDIGLEHMFSKYTQAKHAPEIEDGIAKLYALFPNDDVVAQDKQDAPVVRENTANGQEQLLLLSTFRISAGGADYWLFCADFRENTVDPSNLGIYAIGVAPRTASGDSAAEKALFAWGSTFNVDASTPPGILISQ